VAPLAEFVQVAAEHGPDQVFPMAFPNTVVSVHVGYVATLLGITGPAVAVCGEHAGLEAVVEALSLLSAGRADRALAIGADAAEPTVLSGEPDAAEGAAAVRLSAAREPTCLAEVTGCWTAPTYEGLPADVRPAADSVAADRFGATAGAARVAAAALALASDGRPRTVVGPSGVRGVAAIRLEAA
jgi:3-hydroxy-3-methylglutaryl CoA synthase